LNAVIGFSEMMKQRIFGPLGSEKYGEYANVINSAGRHLLDQINQVLDLSKIDAGKMTFEFEDVKIDEIADYVENLLEPQIQSRSHNLKIDIPDAFPMLHADKTMLTQIVMNLLSNAIKFTPENGQIQLQAELQNECIVISVTDNGIGIEKDMLKQVIDPFVQIRSALTRSEQGTGLGLSIVASLVEHHGGQIDLESEVDKGTKVTITFPAFRTVHLN
jgi:two-component system cell cycle sensor histidine kinase PleC